MSITNAENRMKKSIQALEENFSAIRTGRASSALFDKISVDYFGTPTPLNQLATISTPEARLVVIQPWDKSVLAEIEKAIQKSELSLNPNNDGKVIRLNIPPLTDDRRKELVKLAKQEAEQAKVAIRNIRRDANEELKQQQKASEISEDEEKRLETQVQKITDESIKTIDAMLKEKENEITEI